MLTLTAIMRTATTLCSELQAHFTPESHSGSTFMYTIITLVYLQDFAPHTAGADHKLRRPHDQEDRGTSEACRVADSPPLGYYS